MALWFDFPELGRLGAKQLPGRPLCSSGPQSRSSQPSAAGAMLRPPRSSWRGFPETPWAASSLGRPLLSSHSTASNSQRRSRSANNAGEHRACGRIVIHGRLLPTVLRSACRARAGRGGSLPNAHWAAWRNHNPWPPVFLSQSCSAGFSRSCATRNGVENARKVMQAIIGHDEIVQGARRSIRFVPPNDAVRSPPAPHHRVELVHCARDPRRGATRPVWHEWPAYPDAPPAG